MFVRLSTKDHLLPKNLYFSVFGLFFFETLYQYSKVVLVFVLMLFYLITLDLISFVL